MSLAQYPWQTPVPRPVPPTCLGPPRKVSRLSPVPPRSPCLPRGKLAQPQPTVPNTPAWILPFCVEAGAGGAGAAEQTGGHAREGQYPNLPKILLHCGLSSSPRHQHLPGQAARAHTPGWPGATAGP